MLLFGHVGITLGVAVVLNSALNRDHYFSAGSKEIIGQSTTISKKFYSSRYFLKTVNSLGFLAESIDIRLLITGSVLPDIIDKPIDLLFFSSGRVFNHTLLLLLLMVIGGIYLRRAYHRKCLLTLSFCYLMHLILDAMWLMPGTLLWPIYGFNFEKIDLSPGIWEIWYKLLTENLFTMISEFLGLTVIIWFIFILVYKRKLRAFIRKGKV